MSDKVFTVGICGRSGSGKSFVSEKIAKKLGALYVDADEVYHKLLEPVGSNPSPCCLEIAKKLGSHFIGMNGTLDRKALAAEVFSKKGKLEILNELTHSFIFEAIKEKVSDFDGEYAVVDAALLPFSKCKKLCDYTVAVIVDDETSLGRITERDNISETDAKKRLSAQPSAEEFENACDGVILNGNGSNVEIQISNFVERIKLINNGKFN